MIYPQAIMQTMIGMGPTYVHYIFTWVKMAVWDAPYRVWLDIELEKISIERNICNHPCEPVSYTHLTLPTILRV